MRRSELKQIIREVIEEGKKNLDGPGNYTTPVEVGDFTITGWGRDTNGNSVIKYSFIEDGKEKNRSSQLGGLIGPLNDSEYKDREKGPGKKLIDAFKKAIDEEWISIPKRLKGKKVEESRVLSRRRIVQEAYASEAQSEKIKEWYSISKEIDDFKEKIKELEMKVQPIIAEILPALESLEDRQLIADKIILKVNKMGFDRKDASYKDAFNNSLSKVNEATRKVLEKMLEESKKITKVKTTVKFSEEGVVNNIKTLISNIKRKVTTWLKMIRDIDKPLKELKKLTEAGAMEESRRFPSRRIVQEAVQTPKSLRKVAAKIKKIVTDNYPDIMSLDDLPVSLQNKLEAEADHELFWQDVDRYIGDLYSELGR